MSDERESHPMNRQFALLAIVSVFAALQFTAVEIALYVWGYEDVWLFEGAIGVAWTLAVMACAVYLAQRRHHPKRAPLPAARIDRPTGR